MAQRQLCWAHLKREFTKISERSAVSRQLGRDLLSQQKKLFRAWGRVRDGTLSRSEFQSLVSPIQPTFRTLSCHREKLRREKIKVSIKINIRSEKRHLRNSKAPKMASKPILNKEQ